jgi:hypothetical protein
VEVPVLVSSPEVWAQSQVTLGGSSCCTHGGSPEVFALPLQVAGPWGFLYSWVLLMFGLGTLLSDGPPLGEPTCTGNLPYNVIIPFCTKFAGAAAS